MRDGTSSKQTITAIAPISVAAAGSAVGAVVDGQGFDALTYVISVGVSDTVLTPLLEESDASGGTYTPVVDAELISHESAIAPEVAATFAATDDGKTVRLGYRGAKQFTRLTMSAVGGAAGLVSALAILERASQEPVIPVETVTPA